MPRQKMLLVNPIDDDRSDSKNIVNVDISDLPKNICLLLDNSLKPWEGVVP